MFDTILKKLRTAPETSAALYSANAEAIAARPAAVAALAAAEAERAGLLLTGSEKEILSSEGRIASARIALDRIEAAAAELARRAAEAENREASEALDRERDAVEAVASRIASSLVGSYAQHSAALAGLLHNLANAEAAVAAINGKLIAAGRGDEILPPVETRVLGAGNCLETVASLLSLTSLRPVAGGDGWGSGKAVAREYNLPNGER